MSWITEPTYRQQPSALPGGSRSWARRAHRCGGGWAPGCCHGCHTAAPGRTHCCWYTRIAGGPPTRRAAPSRSPPATTSPPAPVYTPIGGNSAPAAPHRTPTSRYTPETVTASSVRDRRRESERTLAVPHSACGKSMLFCCLPCSTSNNNKNQNNNKLCYQY